MAEKKQANGPSNERQELEFLKSKGTFKNSNNIFFPRTQSTPLEDQKKLVPLGGAKKSLKVSKGAAEFKPADDTSTIASFLGTPSSGATTPATATGTSISTSTSTNFTPEVKTQTNGVNLASSTFVPATKAAAPQGSQTTTTVPDVASTNTTQPSVTKPTEGATAGGAASTKGSLKSRLKLSSSTFSAGSDTAKPFVPGQQAQTQGTAVPTLGQTTTTPAPTVAAGEWGSKPISKAPADAQIKLASPSKKHAYKFNVKDGQPQGRGGLEVIPETHAENKQAPAAAKVEETKDSLENKKSDVKETPKTEVKETPKPEAKVPEVKKKEQEQPKAETKPEATKVDTKPAAEQKTAAKPVAEQKTVTKPAAEQKPVAKPSPVEQKITPKAEAQPEVKKEAEQREKEVKKVEEPKVEAKEKPEAEKKKPEEKQFVEPEKKEVRIEIVIMSRVDFADAVARLGQSLKDTPLPENLERIKNRPILLEKPSRPNYDNKGKGGATGGNQPKLDRNPSQTLPTPAPTAGAGGDGGFSRSEKKPEPVPEPQRMIVRLGLTEEEKKKKLELSSNVNVWVTKQKAVVDPEEATRKEIKFNLNIITPENFDIIKEKILEIASSKLDNCRKVAEFIIENAWTQKHYVNIYAKLCDFLGRSDKLNFDPKPDAKKKKNDFKLQIMKQIQTVFEDESHANYGTKKKLEEMTPEEKGLYYQKKKQRILGNVSFIGELFLEKFIVIGIVRIITNSLLQKYLEEYNTYQKAVEKPSNRSHEDTVEGLLKFYEIIGQAVEDKEGTKAADKAKSSAVVTNFQKILATANTSTPTTEALPKLGNDEISLNDLFKIFNTILNESNISTRLDSLIKNLIYRRENKWQAPLSKAAGPKTMKEIHAEFEREQMEMERRADEYREELRDYQPRRGGNDKYGGDRGGRTEVSFQVVKDTKKKEEETKIDTSSIDVDTNISFRPVRGKGNDKQDSKEQPKKPRVNFEEIEKALKDIYKIIGGEQLEERGTPEEELKKLSDKFGGREVLRIYFKTFYDGRQDAVKKRLFVPNFLIESGAITAEDFLDQFENVMYKMCELACDYPGVDNYFSILMLNYCKKVGDGSPLGKISFSKEFYEKEESEMVLEFYQDFFRALLKNLNEEFADIKDKIKEEDLKAFADNIKVENFDDFRSSL